MSTNEKKPWPRWAALSLVLSPIIVAACITPVAAVVNPGSFTVAEVLFFAVYYSLITAFFWAIGLLLIAIATDGFEQWRDRWR